MGILQVPALTFTVVHLRPAKEQLTSWCHSPRVGRAVLSLSPETNTCLEDALWGASPLLLVLGARASHPLLGSSFQRGNMGFLGGVPLGGPDPPAHLTWGLHLVAVWPWALDLPPVHSSDDKAPYYMGDSAWYTSPECLLASEWQSQGKGVVLAAHRRDRLLVTASHPWPADVRCHSVGTDTCTVWVTVGAGVLFFTLVFLLYFSPEVIFPFLWLKRKIPAYTLDPPRFE